MKIVHKRSGELVTEPGDTIYTQTLDSVKNRLAHLDAIEKFSDKDVSLKEYLIEFYKSYNYICESLKKTL